MNGVYTEIERDLLESLYWGNQYTQREIGDMFGVSQGVIYHRMTKYSIPARSFSEANKGIINLNEKNGNWKGEDVGYGCVHSWVRRRKPKPDKCVMCGKQTPYEIANLSGKYKRDVRDYIWVCRSCHGILDRRFLVSRLGK